MRCNLKKRSSNTENWVSVKRYGLLDMINVIDIKWISKIFSW